MVRSSSTAARALRPSASRPRWSRALVAPALLLIAFAILYPLATSVWQSITLREEGTYAYAWVFGNSVYLKIIWRTITTGLFVAAICLAAGYPLAYLISSSGPRVAAVLMVFTILPFWTSLLVRVFAWLILFQPHGIADNALGLFGFDGVLLGTRWAPTIAMAQLLLPFMFLPLVASMRGIDKGLVRAAESLGASPFRAFRSIFLPLSMPGVVAGSLIVFIMSLGFYLAPALLGSPSSSLLAQAMFQQVGSLLNFGRGGALATLLLVVTFGVLGTALAVRRVLSGGRP